MKSKNIILFLVFFFSFIFVTNFSSAWADNGSAFQYVDGCGTLSTAGATYEMNASISYGANTNCFTFSANNILFNMSNYSIQVTGGTGTQRVIYVQNRANISFTSSQGQPDASEFAGMIKTKVNNGATGYQRGLVIEGSNNVSLEHVWASCYDDPTHVTSNNEGILIQNSNNVYIKNVDWTNFFWRQAVWVLSSDNVTFENITYKHVNSATTADGRFLYVVGSVGDYSNNIVIKNLTCLDGVGTDVILVASYSNNTLIQNSLLNSTGYALQIQRVNRNVTAINNTIIGGVSLNVINTAGTPTIRGYDYFEGNNISSYGNALYLYGYHHNIFKNNIFNSSGNDAVYMNSLYATYPAVNNTFDNNIFISPSTPTSPYSIRTNSVGNGNAKSPSITMGTDFTIAATINNNQVTGADYAYLIGERQSDIEDIVRFQSNSYVVVRFGSGERQCNIANTTGTHRLVISKVSADDYSKIYYDGAEIGCLNLATQAGKSFNAPMFLSYPMGWDEIIIKNTSSDLNWVTNDWKGGTMKIYNSSEPNIIHGWHFDEGSGTKIVDFVDGSANLTLSGNITWASGLDGVTRYDLSVSNLNIQIVNNTYLKNQPTGRYGFFNNGGTFTFEDTNFGLINFTRNISSAGSNLSSDIQILSKNAYINSSKTGLNSPANILLYNIGTFIYPLVFRDGIRCDASTSPSCIVYGALQTLANFSIISGGNYTVREFYGIENAYPTNGSVLDRQNSTWINATIYGGTGYWDVTFYNVTDPNNNITIATISNVLSGSNVSTYLSNLPVGTAFKWFVKLYDGVTTAVSQVYEFYPNNEPAIKNVHATINETEVKFYWENEMNMEWVSLYLGNEWLELRSITSIFDSWVLTNVYPGRSYLFKWQTGDNLMSMSDMHNFSVRSYGWNLDNMSDYTYRRLITINSSNIISDKEGYAVNLTLDENNFQWCTGSNWWDSCYPAFTHINWTNANDIRFTNDYDYNLLPYNITYKNIPADGGQSTQTIPNENRTTGMINDADKMNDGYWNTYSVPAPYGVYYYNYTIPAGAKTNSMFRMYDGEWFWDGQLPIDCYGGAKLRFKSEIDYNTPYIKTYCQNNADNTWISIKNTTSAHFYETMMTWQYEAQLYITLVPEHYSDNSQSLVPGIDGNYDTSFWMYYGNSNVENGESVLSYSGIIQDNYSIGAEEQHILGVPIISNINDTEGKTDTGLNISWDVDQETDNSVRYATNPWLLDYIYYSSEKQMSETFEHQYGNIAHKIKLKVYGDDWIGVVSVTASNSSYSAMYALNISTDGLPVELNIPDLNTEEYIDWTIVYNYNKTWDRNTQRPVFDLAGLTTNTTYWYRVESYGTRGNSTSEIRSFTLGTPVSAPVSNIINYSEDRPNSQITICANVTDIVGFDSASVSFQYFNQTANTFKETDTTTVTSSQVSSGAIVCKTIDTNYGENLTYRTKVVTIPTSTCQGSPYDSNCQNNFFDIGGCTAYSGYNNQCSWFLNQNCDGDQASYCYYSFYDSGSCGGASGCQWNSNYYCAGDQYSYCQYNFYDEGSCNSQSGCYWDGYSCYNSIDCYSQDPYNSCGGYSACYPYDAGYCSNTIDCYSQNTETCYNYGGCYLNDNSYCSNVDTGLTCVDQSNAFACVAIGGCSWDAGDMPITGFSNSYENLFDNKYEFFIGNPVEDEQMYLDRQYCPKAEDGTADTGSTCYEEKGYREGSQQEENWAYIETNLTNADKLEVLKYVNGTQKNGNILVQSIANYSMLTSSNGFRYYNLQNLDSNFYTFKIYDSGLFSDTLVLDWVKPSLTHKAHQNRTDENAFISFNGTPSSIDYKIMYMKTPGTYNTSAYQWCQQQPNGNLYDCMSVQYWGTSGMDVSLTGTAYDRGQFFRGGITNGEPADSGLLQSSRFINSLSGQYEALTAGDGDERFCYSFTVYYVDDSLIPTNNITNYYARYWREDQHWSQYLGINQESTIDQWNLFQWQYDDISMTRDWKEVNGTTILVPSIIRTVNGSIFNSNFNQSLIVGYQEGFNMDVSKDKIYKSGIYFDGQWINQQIGLHQQGFVIFNLPSNATLQGLDSDGDGLNDFNELYQNYTNPFSVDTDEDTMPDGVELAMGYDPNLYTSVADCEDVLFDGCEHRAMTNDYTLNNTNAFAVTIKVNATNALLHNGSAICTGSSNNILLNTGILNITIPANSVCYVLDNYNIEDGAIRDHDAITFTESTQTAKTINLVLNKIQNVNISLGVINCNSVYSVDYLQSGYSSTNLKKNDDYVCTEDYFITDIQESLTKGNNKYTITYNLPSGGTYEQPTTGGVGAGGEPTTNVTTNQTNITVPTDVIVPDTPIQNIINNVVDTVKDVTGNIVNKTTDIIDNPKENIPAIVFIIIIGLILILIIIAIIYFSM